MELANGSPFQEAGTAVEVTKDNIKVEEIDILPEIFNADANSPLATKQQISRATVQTMSTPSGELPLLTHGDVPVFQDPSPFDNLYLEPHDYLVPQTMTSLVGSEATLLIHSPTPLICGELPSQVCDLWGDRYDSFGQIKYVEFQAFRLFSDITFRAQFWT